MENSSTANSHNLDEFEIVTLKSGIKSIRSITRGQTFHPGIGPMAEAEILHVNQQRLLERAAETDPFVIWDVGLGAGANVLAAISALINSTQKISSRIEIHSFDKTISPLEFALQNATALGYLLPYQSQIQELMTHGQVRLSAQITWHLHLSEFQRAIAEPNFPAPHSVLYDPYSAAENLDMWTLEHFQNLRTRLDSRVPSLWSNYTRSTAVRVTLLLAGFYVGRGCSIGEKLETTLASNHLELLQDPLDQKWLERVRRSGNASPMRGPTYSEGPISEIDYELLVRAPQFN